MIFYVALIGFTIGMLLGGNLKSFLDIKLKLIWLILIFGLLSLLPNLSFLSEQISELGDTAAYILAIVRYGSLIIFVVVNRKNIPCVIIGFGGVLNMIVTLANSGKMPISVPEHLQTAALKSGHILNYIVENSTTNLRFLADNIRLPGIEITLRAGKIIGVVYYFVSLGDIIISIGIFLFCLLQPKPKFLFKILRLTKNH